MSAQTAIRTYRFGVFELNLSSRQLLTPAEGFKRNELTVLINWRSGLKHLSWHVGQAGSLRPIVNRPLAMRRKLRDAD
jgi:hypothetical protein